ncbi:MAG: hypothetical protein LBE79_00895 [Tannerella sp.]|jgi:hypothetical protein|nr:hypothetical protein [Tannerella sp.]
MKYGKHKIFILFFLLLGSLTACIEDANVRDDIVTNAGIPVLSDIVRVSQTATTITIKGEVVESKGYPVTDKGVCWGTSLPLDISKNPFKSITDTGDSIKLVIDGLQNSTRYYFRLYATNKAGTNYGKTDSTVTNDGLGSIETFIKHEFTNATEARVGGRISSTGEGDIKECGIYYWQSDKKTPKDSIIGTIKIDSFECKLTNLKPSTDYDIQAYVKNGFGIFLGDTMHLKTKSGMPELSEVMIVAPASNKAVVKAELLSIGDAPITGMGFCWGTMPNPEIDNDTILVTFSGDGIGFITGTILPLLPKQDYYVRAFATNEFGTGYNTPQRFTTTDNMPTVVTLIPEIINNEAVVFKGRVDHVGESNVVSVGFFYSPNNPFPGNSDEKWEFHPSPPVTNVPYEFSSDNITGLRGGTTYYVRAFAVNGNGIVTTGTNTMTILTPQIFTQESVSFTGGYRVEGSPAYFTIGDIGYLLGGDMGYSLTDKLFRYNPNISSYVWGELHSYKVGQMKWLSVAVHSTRAYVLGGMDSGSNVVDSFYVHTSDNFWYPRTVGPPPAHSRTGSSLGNEVVYVGGMKDTAKNEVWVYHVNLDSWSQKADFPVNQYGGFAATIGNSVYAGLGKNTSGVGYKQLWKAGGGFDSWTPEPVELSLSGNIIAGTVFNNKIYVIDKPAVNRYTLFEYNPVTREWKRKSDLPSSYNWDIAFMYTIKNRIYIGFANNDRVVMYNPFWDN